MGPRLMNVRFRLIAVVAARHVSGSKRPKADIALGIKSRTPHAFQHLIPGGSNFVFVSASLLVEKSTEPLSGGLHHLQK
jgi:hypothetical protein